MALGAAITVVILLAVTEVLRPAITPVDTYGVTGALQKEAQMEQVVAEGPVDIVFTGTSQMLVTVDPEIVDAATGLHTYNSSLPGGTPQIQVEWLLDHVVPTLRPRQVAIGVSHLDLLDESPRLNQVIDNWNVARVNHDGPLGEVDRSLSGFSALVDRRQSLRDPIEWMRAVRRRIQGTTAVAPGISATLTDRGLERIWADVEYQGTDEVLTWTEENVVPTYEVGPLQTAALRGMLEGLQENGIEVVLVLMPLTADLVELHPHGEADVEAGMAALAAEAERAGVEILRYDSAPWPEELFADPLHLNGRGTEIFSQLIAADLAASPDGLLRGGDHSDAGDAAIAGLDG